ncbi:TIGR04086 family membrane protein [Metallumcola ferriviriculae]|uniref:TIGR04086 family membrane protein n=1 Tax=Metallumcola ferriviriculae TaxID=3039180 RepID=A0AAU0UPC5_9FIRM|nr:TIGR04086 family membrane protein [Desulfitibacteraceae bacterium MK1]
MKTTVSTYPSTLNSVFKGVVTSLVLTLIFTFIAALAVYISPLSEKFLSLTSLIILLVSVFVGGNIAARRAGGKGLIVGFLVGLGFFFLLILIGLVFTPQTLTLTTLSVKLVYTLLAGILGGISAVAAM